MDKQDWTPTTRTKAEEVYYVPFVSWGIESGTRFSFDGHRPLDAFTERDQAKAALIEKLEAALEEAKRL